MVSMIRSMIYKEIGKKEKFMGLVKDALAFVEWSFIGGVSYILLSGELLQDWCRFWKPWLCKPSRNFQISWSDQISIKKFTVLSYLILSEPWPKWTNRFLFLFGWTRCEEKCRPKFWKNFRYIMLINDRLAERRHIT